MWFAIFLLSGVAGLTQEKVDPDRLAAELAADGDVIRSLRNNGDEPTNVRPVDVRFVGAADSIERLRQAAPEMGWRVIQTVAQDDGSTALDLQRDQTTELPVLTALTKEALQLEAAFGVRYDGWGTAATPRR